MNRDPAKQKPGIACAYITPDDVHPGVPAGQPSQGASHRALRHTMSRVGVCRPLPSLLLHSLGCPTEAVLTEGT